MKTLTITKGYNGNPYSKKMIAIDKTTGEQVEHYTIILVNKFFYGTTSGQGVIFSDSKLLELQELNINQ